jgi:hypothetical protein
VLHLHDDVFHRAHLGADTASFAGVEVDFVLALLHLVDGTVGTAQLAGPVADTALLEEPRPVHPPARHLLIAGRARLDYHPELVLHEATLLTLS